MNMNHVNSIISDVNNFSKKSMPLTSKIFYKLFPEFNSDVCKKIHEDNDKLYECFSKGLSDNQKTMFFDLADHFFGELDSARTLEGFNGGFYMGFHFAMELMKKN